MALEIFLKIILYKIKDKTLILTYNKKTYTKFDQTRKTLI